MLRPAATREYKKDREAPCHEVACTADVSVDLDCVCGGRFGIGPVSIAVNCGNQREGHGPK
jgi:hypothetical protein